MLPFPDCFFSCDYGDIDIIGLAAALLIEYKMRVIIADSHGQKQQEIQSVSIELDGSIISAFK